MLSSLLCTPSETALDGRKCNPNNMSKGGNTNKKKQILAGHKKIGKCFVPPMMQLPKLVNTCYVDDMLPELIWIGLINERFGYIRGARIIEKVFITVEKYKENGQEGNYALMSCFNKLNCDQKIAIADSLRKEQVLETIQNSIAPLVILYDNCPLIFFGPPVHIYSRDDLIMLLKKCISKTINRYDTPAIVLFGAMLIARLVTNTVSLSPNIDLPDLNSVINSPDSEEAKISAGFMRASGLAEFGMMKIEKVWAKHFWNKNFELSACEFADE